MYIFQEITSLPAHNIRTYFNFTDIQIYLTIYSYLHTQKSQAVSTFLAIQSWKHNPINKHYAVPLH